MITTLPINHRLLTILSVVLAFILPLTAADILTFRFSNNAQPSKPYFLSLGSILSSEETQLTAYSKTMNNSAFPNQPGLLIEKLPASSSTAFYRTSNTKPTRLRSEQRSAKETIKPVWEGGTQHLSQPAPQKASENLPALQPVYEPLKLKESWSQ